MALSLNVKEQIAKLPKSPGVYLFSDSTGKLLYVGKSSSIKNRVGSYFRTNNLGPKTNLLVKKIAKISYIKVFSEFEALLLEAELIKENQPFFNIQAKDDKSPLYIKITNDPVPLVTTTRRERIAKKTLIAGPFPSSRVTHEILRIVRKIFPYCHHKNPKKPCLYVHLGLCPYPYASASSKHKYRVTVTKIKRLISGKNKQLLRQLTNEMSKSANQERFEEAQKVKKQIEKIEYLFTTYHPPQEFLEQPTLVDDQVQAKLKDLSEKLDLKDIPKRIECYDISNIAGKYATGSMVTFTTGRSDKSGYRRFKIKFLTRPNDYEMIKQVLKRRLANPWPKADLIIIDGGKGHLNSALSVLNKFKVKIPIIAIAKRFEEIYVAGKIMPISLPKESAARQLVQAIRDEAHRFAVTYHRLLRSKSLLAN